MSRLLADAFDWTYSWMRYAVFMALPRRIRKDLKNPFVTWALGGAGIAYCGTWTEYRALRAMPPCDDDPWSDEQPAPTPPLGEQDG